MTARARVFRNRITENGKIENLNIFRKLNISAQDVDLESIIVHHASLNRRKDPVGNWLPEMVFKSKELDSSRLIESVSFFSKLVRDMKMRKMLSQYPDIDLMEWL